MRRRIATLVLNPLKALITVALVVAGVSPNAAQAELRPLTDEELAAQSAPIGERFPQNFIALLHAYGQMELLERYRLMEDRVFLANFNRTYTISDFNKNVSRQVYFNPDHNVLVIDVVNGSHRATFSIYLIQNIGTIRDGGVEMTVSFR